MERIITILPEAPLHTTNGDTLTYVRREDDNVLRAYGATAVVTELAGDTISEPTAAAACIKYYNMPCVSPDACFTNPPVCRGR